MRKFLLSIFRSTTSAVVVEEAPLLFFFFTLIFYAETFHSTRATMCPNTRVRFRHTANNLVSRKKVKWLEKTYNLARFGGPKIANRKSNYNCTVHFDVRRIVVVTNTSRWTFRRKQTDRWGLGLLRLLMLGRRRRRRGLF